MSSRYSLRQMVTPVLVAALVGGVGACQPVGAAPPVTTELSDSAWPSVSDSHHPDLVWQASHTAITRYLNTTDVITRDGGQAPHRMAPVTTSAWFPTEQAAFAHYRNEGLRTIGTTVFDSLVVQSVTNAVDGGLHIDVIACVDATWVWLLPQEAPDPPPGLIDWLRDSEEAEEIPEDQFDQWSSYLETVSPTPGERQAIVFWLVGSDPATLKIDGTVNWEGASACHLTTTD